MRAATSASAPYGFAGSVAASTATSGVVRRVAQRAQQVERAGQRELRGAEAGDEVAAPDAAASSIAFSTG